MTPKDLLSVKRFTSWVTDDMAMIAPQWLKALSRR